MYYSYLYNSQFIICSHMLYFIKTFHHIQNLLFTLYNCNSFYKMKNHVVFSVLFPHLIFHCFITNNCFPHTTTMEASMLRPYQFICDHSLYNYSSIYFPHCIQQTFFSIFFIFLSPLPTTTLLTLPSSNPMAHILSPFPHALYLYKPTFHLQSLIAFTIILFCSFQPF